MRILFVSSVADAQGGAERSLLELARALRGRGHRVALAAWADGDLATAFGGLGETFTLAGSGDPASPLGGATRRVPLLRPFVRAANWLRLLLRPTGRETRWLAAVARETGADVIHTNCDLSPMAAEPAARELDTAWVAHVRDLTRSWLHPRTAGALRNADAVVAPSAFLAAGLRGRDIDADIVPNPLSDAEFRRRLDAGERARIRAGLGLDPAAFLVAVVGRLDEQKGTLRVVEAARGLDPAASPPIRFVVAGSGTERFEARLRRVIRKTDTGDRIHLLGHRADVGHWLPALDALAMPSTGEGFGRSVVEAMHAGLPVVAFRDGAAPELIEDGRTGLLVPAGDAAGLADALRALAGDPDRARRLGEAGQSGAERYHPDAVAARMEMLYHRITEG